LSPEYRGSFLPRSISKNAATYNGNLSRFNTKLDAKYAEWQKELAPYRGARIVTYHKDFIYFAGPVWPEHRRRVGAEAWHRTFARAPRPGHRQDESGECQGHPGAAVSDRKTAETVARQTGATVLDTPEQPELRPHHDLLRYDGQSRPHPRRRSRGKK